MTSSRTEHSSDLALIPNRRQMLATALVASLCGLPQMRVHGETAKRSRLLARPQGIDLLETRCKVILELEGELRIEEPDPKKAEKIRTAEVRCKATHDYFETIAFDQSLPAAAARRYITAESENWVSGSASTHTLRPTCARTFVVEHKGTWEQYCDAEPLERREVELLRSPINTLALEQLLSVEPATPTSSWEIPAECAKHVFNLEAVHASTVQAKITAVEQGTATVELSGELDATANSVPTKLTIKGSLHAKLGKQCVMITWLGASIQEERSISEIEPGFAITARIQLIRADSSGEIETDRANLLSLRESQDTGRWLVQLESIPGRYSMLTERNWFTYIDGGEEAILRMIENNTVIAQCNIARLPELEEGTHLSLEGMQADIKKALGDSFGEMLESSEKATDAGLRVLRTVVMGKLEDVPIQWIYVHASNDAGRRLALVFTMGGNYTERFAAADEQMASSLEMLPEVTEAQPSVAPQLSSAPQAQQR